MLWILSHSYCSIYVKVWNSWKYKVSHPANTVTLMCEVNNVTTCCKKHYPCRHNSPYGLKIELVFQPQICVLGLTHYCVVNNTCPNSQWQEGPKLASALCMLQEVNTCLLCLLSSAEMPLGLWWFLFLKGGDFMIVGQAYFRTNLSLVFASHATALYY